MKKKIKLRDLTPEQWDKNKYSLCNSLSNAYCENCIFQWTGGCLDSIYKNSWINHKDCYSDKVLDQEVEIEVPDILTKEEKEYLRAVISPFRYKVLFIKKLIYFGCYHKGYFINIKVDNKFDIFGIQNVQLPYFQDDMYEKMEIDKEYTLEDLGL